MYDDGQYLHVYLQGLELIPEISLYNTHSQSVKLGGVLIEGKETKHLMLKHESLTPGIYFIRLTAKDQVDSYKFLVK